MTDPVPSNIGHGHVFPRPDGVRARCGGPAMCRVCAADLARKNIQETVKADPVPSKDLLTRLRTGYLCEVEGCKCHAIEARSGCQCAEAADEIDRQQAQIATLKGYIERTALAGYRCAECAARLTAEPAPAHEEAIEQIYQWADAYPMDVFPEPDLKRSAEVLKAAGLSLDRISAHAMRHVITKVKEIAVAALGRTPQPPGAGQ